MNARVDIDVALCSIGVTHAGTVHAWRPRYERAHLVVVFASGVICRRLVGLPIVSRQFDSIEGEERIVGADKHASHGHVVVGIGCIDVNGRRFTRRYRAARGDDLLDPRVVLPDLLERARHSVLGQCGQFVSGLGAEPEQRRQPSMMGGDDGR